MKHAKALGIKFIMISIVLLSLFGIFRGASFGEIILMSILVTGLAYVVGDLFTLPRTGNVVATIADFGLTFFAIWILSTMFMENTSALITASLAAAGLISLAEALFHSYMQNKVLDNTEEQSQTRPQFRPSYQTEFAEEYENETEDLKKK
ncbi:YndM family protein [Bacillus sinesaloumensis]|uniref:YndM family protein n=1 Tax=Litchfieldia sinesaloumensis TaxID=1926280 RepID=UPI000988864F|nr:YndM family protein [Bacillus sinesaloumensis]